MNRQKRIVFLINSSIKANEVENLYLFSVKLALKQYIGSDSEKNADDDDESVATTMMFEYVTEVKPKLRSSLVQSLMSKSKGRKPKFCKALYLEEKKPSLHLRGP